MKQVNAESTTGHYLYEENREYAARSQRMSRRDQHVGVSLQSDFAVDFRIRECVCVRGSFSFVSRPQLDSSHMVALLKRHALGDKGTMQEPRTSGSKSDDGASARVARAERATLPQVFSVYIRETKRKKQQKYTVWLVLFGGAGRVCYYLPV